MSVLDELNWQSVREQYDVRCAVHNGLNRLFSGDRHAAFFEVALGISDPAANYSASDHGLGPKIRSENVAAEGRVHELAGQFRGLTRAREVPEMIRQASIKYLSIGVGSELSCLVNPTICWVANTRSIWTHLVVKHADNYARANEELELYRTADVTSEMAYAAWSAIHAELDVALTRRRSRANPRGRGERKARSSPRDRRTARSDGAARHRQADSCH